MADHVQLLLRALRVPVTDFAGALSLIDHIEDLTDEIPMRGNDEAQYRQKVEKRKWMMRWEIMPLRDASITLYHFETITDAIVKGTRTCPWLLQRVEDQKLRKVQPLFTKYFPHASMMRNAVGHLSDWIRTPQSIKQHAFFGEYDDGEMIINYGKEPFLSLFTDRRFVLTNNGRVTWIDVTLECLHRLIEVQVLIYSAFEKINRLTSESRHT